MPAIPSGIPVCPAPWLLQAESWIFPFWSKPEKRNPTEPEKKASPNATSEATIGLPPASYFPLETLPDVLNVETPEHLRDVFTGGLGGWVLYRYSESPAGPYDELIYVAGSFRSPTTGKSSLRITSIFVSSDESTWNGRANWNIPKHKADFFWTSPPSSKEAIPQTVRVTLPSTSPLVVSDDGHIPSTTTAIFSAHLLRSKLPSLPCIDTSFFLFPRLPLIQPPVRECKAYRKTGSGDTLIECASEPATTYRSTAPTFRGRARLAYAQPALTAAPAPRNTVATTVPSPKPALKRTEHATKEVTPEDDSAGVPTPRRTYGDGIAFPHALGTWGYGLHFEHVEVTFPVPVEIEPRTANGNHEEKKSR